MTRTAMFLVKQTCCHSMWCSVNPWSADTQKASLHIDLLDMLAADLACKLSSLFEQYWYSLLVWESLESSFRSSVSYLLTARDCFFRPGSTNQEPCMPLVSVFILA